MRKLLLSLLFLGLSAASALASNCSSFTYTLTNGTTADANQVMSNFNNLLNCANNNLAHNGANSDITQLTGLTTPLTVPQGGTGLGTLTSNNVYVGNGTGTPSPIGGYKSLFRNLLQGLTLSNDTGTPNSVLDISVGGAFDSTNTSLIAIGSAFTKSTGGAWAAGSGSNGMGTGLTITASTWYHVFAITNNGSSDFYFDTSVTAANAPANTSAFRRIGSFLTDGSAHIIAFIQNGDTFLWATPVADLTTSAVTTSASLVTLTVPPGVVVNALFRGDWVTTAVTSSILVITSPNVSNIGASDNNASLYSYLQATTPQVATLQAGEFNVQTNTSAQIRLRSSANGNINIGTFGWVDSRGKNL